MDKKKVAKASARIGAKSIIKSAMFASWVAKTGLTVTHNVLGGAASLTNSLMGGTSLSTPALNLAQKAEKWGFSKLDTGLAKLYQKANKIR